MQRIADLFKALGDENRLRILNLLANRGEICVCDLVAVLKIPQARISKHLTVLRHAGWVHQRREGIWMQYTLAQPGMNGHDTGILACQIDCMKCCFTRLEDFARDLRAYDELMKTGVLMRCRMEELRHENPSPGNRMPQMQTAGAKCGDGCL